MIHLELFRATRTEASACASDPPLHSTSSYSEGYRQGPDFTAQTQNTTYYAEADLPSNTNKVETTR